MKLHEMTDEAIQLQEEILAVYSEMDETGELTPELETRLDAAHKRFEELVVDRSKKIDAILCVIKDSEASSESILTEVENMKYRAKMHAKTATSLKSYLMQELKRSGLKKYETLHGWVSLQKNGAPSIKCVGEAPEWCTKVVPEQVLFDAQRAVKELRAGGALPEDVGTAEVEFNGGTFQVSRGEHLRIR